MTDAIQNIPYAELRTSPLNTRKTFNAEAIERLADSIAAQGIQQNLVARHVRDMEAPTLDQFYYELVAGERRYRACGVLIARGERPAETTLPVRVVHCDDAALLELNLIENLQREDMHPLDEAEGYAALIAAGRTIAHIADMVPFTKRHVELRLQLAGNLSAEAKTAFRAGGLTLAQARTLAAYAPPDRQASVIERITTNPDWYDTAEDLKDELLDNDTHIPVDAAFFTRADYTGGVVQDPEDPALEYFTDVEQFKRLQSAAVLAASAELRREWGWAEIERGAWFGSHKYGRCENKKASGAIVFVNENTHEVTVHTGLVKLGRSGQGYTSGNAAADAAKGIGAKTKDKSAPPAPEAYLPTRAGLAQAKTAKTHALRAAMIETGRRPAMIAVILAMMGARGDVHLARADMPGPRIDSPAVAEALAKFRPWFKGAIRNHGLKSDAFSLDLDHGRGGSAKAFEILAKFTDWEIEELFTALVATTVGTYPGLAADLGDGPIAAGLARQCAADVTGHWKIDAAYLETCRKLPLQRIAASIGVTRADACLSLDDVPLFPGDFAKLKAMDLRAAILAHLKREPDAAVFLPAPFHFGTPAELLTMAAPAAENKKPAATVPPKARAKPKTRAKIKSPAKTKAARTRIANKVSKTMKAAVVEGFRP